MSIENRVEAMEKLSPSQLSFATYSLLEASKCKTLGEIEKLPYALNVTGEHFIDDTRIAFAIQLYLNGQAVMISRNTEIYLDGIDIPQVNLGLVDAVIASRVFLPGGDYGLLGKLDKLRGCSEKYAEIKCTVVPDFNLVATEFNPAIKEHSIMIRAKVFVDSVPDWFENDVLSSSNIILGTSKI